MPCMVPFVVAAVAFLVYAVLSWWWPRAPVLPGSLSGLKGQRLGEGFGYYDAAGNLRAYRAPNGRIYAPASGLVMLQWAAGIGLPTGNEPVPPPRDEETGRDGEPKRTLEERVRRGAGGASLGATLGGLIGGALGTLVFPGVGSAGGAAAGAAIGATLFGGGAAVT